MEDQAANLISTVLTWWEQEKWKILLQLVLVARPSQVKCLIIWTTSSSYEFRSNVTGERNSEATELVKKMVIVAQYCFQVYQAQSPPTSKILEMLESQSFKTGVACRQKWNFVQLLKPRYYYSQDIVFWCIYLH